MSIAELRAKACAFPANNPNHTGRSTRIEKVGSIQVVSFKPGAARYGISIQQVQEVILIGEVTQVPQVPP